MPPDCFTLRFRKDGREQVRKDEGERFRNDEGLERLRHADNVRR
jgi:hypothetical protein